MRPAPSFRLLALICLSMLPLLPAAASEPEVPDPSARERALPAPPRPLQKGTPFSVVDEGAAAPANDAFSGAEALPGFPAQIEASNEGASLEAGEPRPCGAIAATVWYRLVADRNADLVVHTFGSDFDTVLGVYRGTSLANVEEVGCSDDSGWTLQSKVAFPVVAGTTYYVQVGGYSGDTGGFVLSTVASGGIAGTVTGEAALEGVCVDVYDTEGEFIDEVFSETGTYTVHGLVPGDYHLHFLDCASGDHLDEWYDDAADVEMAEPVAVVGEQTTAGIDAVLALGGTITGTVVSDEGHELFACIQVFDEAGDFAGHAFAPSGEEFSAGGLRTGTYRVRVADCFSDTPHAAEWYDDAGTRTEADPVAVVQGQETFGIDVGLPMGGYITGIVSTESGSPKRHVCVDAFDAAGDWVGYGYTGGDGAYSISGLRAGAYTILFTNCGPGNLASEWYADQPQRATANPVVVASGEATAGIDAVLSKAGMIRGRITDAAGRPIRYTCVDAYSADGEFAAWGYTNGNGVYRVRGLQGGAYRLQFVDCEGGWRNGGAFRSEFYDDRPDLATADVIDVALGQVAAGNDAVLMRPGALLVETGGTAVGEAGLEDAYSVALGAPPLADVTVSLEPDEVEVSPQSLTFTPSNWNVPQPVTLRAADDSEEEGPHTGVVEHVLSSLDPEFVGRSETLYVEVEDDDLVPDAPSLVYDGDASVVRGERITLSATLTDAATGAPIEDRRVRLELGGLVVERWTDEEGHVQARPRIDLPYGDHSVRVSSAGDPWYEPAEITAPVTVAWQYTFADGDRAVLVNPRTDELRFVAPGDASAIKRFPTVQVQTLPTGDRLVRVAYADDELTVELGYQPESGHFAGVVKTAASQYVLRGIA